MKDGKERGYVLDCNNIFLSIIIPVYNTSAYLKRCLDSVEKALENVVEKCEVLIINDGSTDNSSDIINKFCLGKSSIYKVYEKENGGLSDVKNYGLKYARGTYVIFLDSDDYVPENMYQELLDKIKENNADVAVCDIKLKYDDDCMDEMRSCITMSRDEVFSQVIDMSMMPASWNKIVKKELYKDLTFPVGKNNEDVAVTPIVLGRAKKIVTTNNTFYNYYQRQGSIQNSEFNEKRFIILETAQICMERIKELPPKKQEIIKGSIYLHQILSLAFYPIKRERFKKRYELLKKYMEKVNHMFPDIWNNYEIKEFVTWQGVFYRTYRKISVYLLKHKFYYMTAVFWAFCNKAEYLNDLRKK